jgi:hypothetical protein
VPASKLAAEEQAIVFSRIKTPPEDHLRALVGIISYKFTIVNHLFAARKP